MKKNRTKIVVCVGISLALLCVFIKALFPSSFNFSSNARINPPARTFKVVAVISGTQLQNVLNQQSQLGWYYEENTGIFTISGKTYVLFKN